MRNILVAIVIGIILALAIWISFQLRGREAAQPPEITVADPPAEIVAETINVADYTIRIEPNRNRQARIEYEVAQANQVEPTATPLPVQSAETATPIPPASTNTPIPQVVPTNTSQPQPTVQPGVCGSTARAHVVQQGDNVFRIGLSYGVDRGVIAAANNLNAAYTIYPGDVLCIPNADTVVDTVGNTTCTANSPIHVVQQGENVFRISLNYGVDEEAIRIANNLNANYTIFPGDRLCIP